MNAVVSGQAGVALLLDGDMLSSLRAGRPGEVVRRSPGEVPLLFGDAKDLQFLEGVELEEVSSRLERANEEVDALHLALILLDESLEPDTRRTAAEELDEMLGLEGIQRFVENILHAHPLPRGADLAGALASCPGNANLTRRLLERLGSLQGVITEVYFAWEQIPEDLFDGKRDRAYAQSIAAREGFFRDLVILRAARGSISSFLKRAILNERIRAVRNNGEILRAWLAPLRSEESVQPQAEEAEIWVSSLAEPEKKGPRFSYVSRRTPKTRVSFDPRQRHKVPLGPRRLAAQVRASIQSQPKLVQGQLLLTIVRADDGSEWWAFCCPVRDSKAHSQGIDSLEIFDLIPPQTTDIGRFWFDLIKACAEIYCARWRQSVAVSHLESGRATIRIERLIPGTEKFMALVDSSHTEIERRRLEYLLVQAKEALRNHYSELNEGTTYSMLNLERALWCIHQVVDRLGIQLGLRRAAEQARASRLAG